MRNGLVHLFLLLAVCLLNSSCTSRYSGKVPPKVINGEIDLTGWNFKKDGPVGLEGNWHFTWGEYYPAANPNKQNVGFLMVPGNWLSFKAQDKVTAVGKGYYRLLLRNISDEELSLYLPTIGSSGSIRIKDLDTGEDNEWFQLGSPYGGVEKSLPSKRSAIKTIPGNRKDFELIIDIANYYSENGGLWFLPYVGHDQDLYFQRMQSIIISSIMIGILLIMAFYHFSLYYLNRE